MTHVRQFADGITQNLQPNPGPSATHLALREEVGHEGSVHSVLQGAVRKDDKGGFASQLQGDGFDPFSCHLHDLAEARTQETSDTRAIRRLEGVRDTQGESYQGSPPTAEAASAHKGQAGFLRLV